MGKVLSDLYYRAVVLANDAKHIHIHAKGHRFDRIHSICNEYYEKANEQADTLAELGLEYNEPVQNSSLAAQLIGHKPANQPAYNWDEAMQTAYTAIDEYIESLEQAMTTGLDSDVENLLQEFVRYWKKENNYKNRARMEDMGANE